MENVKIIIEIPAELVFAIIMAGETTKTDSSEETSTTDETVKEQKKVISNLQDKIGSLRTKIIDLRQENAIKEQQFKNLLNIINNFNVAVKQ